MQEPVLVVMAAGLGSRYGGLKQMEAVTDAGEIILDFAVFDAWKAGFKKVIFIIKEEMAAEFERRVAAPMRKYLDVTCVLQKMTDLPEGYMLPQNRVKPWGTCHAVMAAAEEIDGAFAVINADDYYGKDAFVKVREFLMADHGENDYCMAGYAIENTLSEQGTVTRGVCVADSSSYLMQIDETQNIGWQPDGSIGAGVATDASGVGISPLTKGTLVSMNFWGFQKSMLDTMIKGFPAFLDKAMQENPLKAEYLLPIEVGRLLQEKKVNVKVLEVQDKWYGVTYKEDKAKVHDAFEAMKKAGQYPAKLW